MSDPNPGSPDVEDALKWLGVWPVNPDAPVAIPDAFQRFYLMEAARDFLQLLGAVRSTASKEFLPGFFLQVDISIRDKEGRTLTAEGKWTE